MAWPALANARLYDKLSKLDTLDPMDFNSIDSFFSDDVWGEEYSPLLSKLRSFRGAGNLPEISKTDTGYEIRIEAPGIPKENLKVELIGKRSLVVSANVEKKSSPTDDGKPPGQPGRSSESESLQLWNQVDIPRDADASKLKTKYENGLLTVSVPRYEAASSPKEDTGVQTAKIDPKSQELEQEVKERLSKIEELRAELEKERTRAMEARQQLEKERRERERRVDRKQIEIQ